MKKLSNITDRVEALEEEGDGFIARCPAHPDSHASLRIALDEKGTVLLKCRAGCETGDVVEALGLTFSDLFDVEADVKITTVTTSSEPLSIGDRARMMGYLRSCQDRLMDYQDDGAYQARLYALDRFGVEPVLARELGLGFDPGHGAESFELLGGVHHQVPRLVVPFFDPQGSPVGFQSRALEEHHVRWAGPVNPPEGGSWSKLAFFSSGSGTDFVVIAEGPGDALTAVAAGIDSVGIRGAAMAPGIAEELAEGLHGRRVALAGDADRSGQLMNDRLAQKLHDLGLEVRVLALPSGVEDLTDWRETSPDSFASDFQNALFEAPRWSPPDTEAEDLEDEEELELPTTHVEIARLVVENFDGRLAYLLGLGFHIFEGGVWTEDRLGKVRLEIHAIGDRYSDMIPEALEELREARRVSEYAEDRAKRKLATLRRFVRFVRSTVELDRIEKEVKGLVKMDSSSFDSHPHLLAVQNGVIDLRTGEILEHSKDYHLTQKVDVRFDADAQAPRWESFLEEVFPGAEGMADYIRRLVGYGITGDTAEQCFAVLWGRGANGKSVFTETLLDVFGGIAKATPFDTFEDKRGGSGIPNDIAALRGARLVFASEGERGKPMAESVLKRVTGQDMISARFMRKEFFEFRPSFLLFMASNHRPNFLSADEGLWRRVKMIPWLRFFEVQERDPYLRQKMVKEESEGILAWAVRGSVEWHREGLGDPSTVKEATASYRDSSDRLSSFFPHGPLMVEEGGEVLAKDVWEAYLEWADEEMLPMKERWGRNTLYSGLEERGLVKARTRDGVMMQGCRMRTEGEMT